MDYLAILKSLDAGKAETSSMRAAVAEPSCEKSEVSELSTLQLAERADFGSGVLPATMTGSPIHQADTGACLYDWQPGYRGLRLGCVTHRHAAGTATVFRTASGGRDTLADMLALRVLTGQAERDARRVQ